MIGEFRSLFPLVRRYRWAYVLGVLSLVVTSGSQLLIPWFIGRAVDTLTIGSVDLTRIGGMMILMVGTAVVIAAGRLGWRYFIHGASRRIENDLRIALYDHLLTLPRSYYERTKTGDLMARGTNDLNAVRMAVGMALVAFIDGLFMTVAILVILFGRNPRLALFTILPLPVITITLIVLGSHIGTLFRSVQAGFSRLSEQAQEVFSGIRVVQVFGKEQYFLRRFGEANENYQRQNMRLVRIWGLFFPLVTFLSGITLLLLLWFGGRSLIAGEITPGDFVATLSYLQMLIWPMLGAGMTVNMLHRGAASMGRINEVLDTPSDITSPANGRTRAAGGTISVRNLSFTYPGASTPSLSDISFDLAAGQTLGILGRTGSGKSTILDLLPRLLDPPEGTIFVDGTDVTRYDLDTLRSAFGLVPQSSFLFSATVADNIRFADPDADDETVRRYGTIAAMDTDVADFPDGWDTVVGERGVTLSGGQRQRIAIARALLKNPPVLMFDDALSAVDTHTEERILASITAERRQQTTIIVSNRVSTLQHADLVLVLEGGTITQRGTHATLSAEPGFYQEVYHLQQQEEQDLPEAAER
ncbi:MAG: ABC transporter ATP-binding protein [Alkalispirochaeta sp.]